MSFIEWIKSLVNISKKDDFQKYSGADLEGVIVAATTGDVWPVRNIAEKTFHNITHLPTMIFWDKMERFLHGSYRNLEEQIRMANKFEAESDDYFRFVKKQISIINQMEDDEKVDFFAMLTRAFLLGCIQTQKLYFKLAKFLMLCTSDELEFLKCCDYDYASPVTVMISALYQFGLFSQSSDVNGETYYVLSDFAKALKQNSLNFYHDLHGIQRLGSYEAMQPLAISESIPVNAIEKLLSDKEITLNGGNASGHNETESASNQTFNLPAVKRTTKE